VLKRALSSVRSVSVGSAFAFVVVAAALIYAVAYHDPYPTLFAAPFFALGCGRGKHPLRLLALSLLPATVLVVVSFVKFTLLGIPLVVYDHYFLRSNVLMLAYNDWRVATGLLISVVGVAFYLRHLLSGKGAVSRIERGALAAFGVAAVGCIAVLLSDPFVAIWEPQANAPTLKTFLKSAQVPKPSLHTDMAAPARDASADTGFGAPGFSQNGGALPDIFLVLQESTFPPATLRPGYEPQTLFAKTAPLGGPLHVHTFAGGTWRTEFSVAVQMRPQEFGSDGLYVFHQLEGRIKRSVFTELKKLGYRTMVFYPVPGSFINAAAFYASIGVDEFYDPITLGISAGWDWKFPDTVLYEAMLKKIEGSKTPVVALMLTINQHGPHNVEDPMSDYVARFADSDRAYGAFLTALSHRENKSGVVAFGDHQPEFTARYLDEGAVRYSTAYDVRCVNFECAGAGPTTKPIDVTMLAPVALAQFGFTLDTFSTRQQALFQACEDDIDRCDETARVGFNTAFSPFFN
jgi:hypothetical protein